MSQYVAFNIEDLRAKARRMPVGFEHDYRVNAIAIDHGAYILAAFDADRLADKYKGYAVSETYEKRDPGVPISGCCDRADQY